jgi:hypothetical protein
MSLLQTDPEAGIYLGQDRPTNSIESYCELDNIKERIIDRVKRILFELKKIFG